MMIHRLATLLLLTGAATFPAQSQVAPMAPSDITNIPPDPALKNWSVRTLQVPMRDARMPIRCGSWSLRRSERHCAGL